MSLRTHVWPRDRAADATRALALAARFLRAAPPAKASAPALAGLASDVSVADLVSDAARSLDLEVEARDFTSSISTRETLGSAPLLVCLPEGAGLLAVLRAKAGRAVLVGPRGHARVPIDVVEDAIWAAMDRDPALRLDGVRERVREAFQDHRTGQRAARALVAPRLANHILAEGWTIHAPSAALRNDLARVRVLPRSLAIVAAYATELSVFLGIWRHVGRKAVATGGASEARAGGWALLGLLGLWAALQLLAATAVRRLALDVGAVVRVWLLRGSLRLDPEHMRSAGIGQLLGRALDAEALDTLALGGGVEALAGAFDLGFGAVVLALGVAPAATLVALAVTTVVLGLGVRAQASRHATWSDGRRAITHDLVERMAGHRTLLVQDRPARQRVEDDRTLASYEAHARRLDRVATSLDVGLPRSFLLVGLGIVGASALGAPWLGAHAAGTPALSPAAIATSIGGIWLAYSGLRRLTTAAGDLIAAREAWRRVRPLVGAHEDESTTTTPPATPPTGSNESTATATSSAPAPLIDVRNVSYRYSNRPRPQLAAVDLAVNEGERVLIGGPSGAGKSTLAAILAGLRAPTSGRLSLRGVDQRVIGMARWRRAVGAAPQFHENHVLGADLLFNLLMGRRWPPRPGDIVLAEAVCRELGLGPLVDRMPAGLQQVVGETGWQLSHGERSRLYIARSLLQVLEARVLDESFAALDPETMDRVMAAVLGRPEALVVIAHP